MKQTNCQKICLLILRMAIGWLLLYEGLVKLSNPDWSGIAYLMDSQGFLKEFYYWMAASPVILKIVNFMNIWGLIAIGAGIFLGLFTRAALISGMVLLLLYYLSHPPFPGLTYAFPTGGNYLFINNVLIEIICLVLLYVFPMHRAYGIDKFIFGSKKY